MQFLCYVEISSQIKNSLEYYNFPSQLVTILSLYKVTRNFSKVLAYSSDAPNDNTSL